jgi:hypothetical protein
MVRINLLFLGFLIPAVGIAAPTMTPGLWEIVMSAEMTGMSQQMPPTKFQHCYRPEDLKDMRRTVPNNKQNCKVTDWKESGNTVTWNVSCAGQGSMTGTGTMTYAGDSYRGNITMNMSQGGQKMTMIQNYQARRIGNCKK